MNKQILEFKKTDHFMFKQWDRNIDDKMLYSILPRYLRLSGDRQIYASKSAF